MLWRICDDLKYLLNEAERYASVEEIAHAVDEDRPWRPPAVGLAQRSYMYRDAESRSRRSRITIQLVLVCAHGLETLSQR